MQLESFRPTKAETPTPRSTTSKELRASKVMPRGVERLLNTSWAVRPGAVVGGKRNDALEDWHCEETRDAKEMRANSTRFSIAG